MDGDGLSTDPETQCFTDLYDDKCRLPTISKWHILCWLEGKCLAMFGIFETSTKWRNTFSVVLRLDVFRAWDHSWPPRKAFWWNRLSTSARSSSGGPEAAYGHGGFWLNCLNSWLDKFGPEPRVYMSLPFTMYCPTMAPYFPVFFSEVKATKPILPWMIIPTDKPDCFVFFIGFQEARWCCTSQRKSACGYSPASHTCIT